ncbi:heparinase II/III family protein [Candidatus Pseudothioglobus singularis]|nr:heparinase II/III family protein [Candidatus Pseudothioglobus singularis]
MMIAFVRNILKYWHTIRYLRLEQIIGRIKRQFSFHSINEFPANQQREAKGFWIFPARRSQRMVKKDVFLFLNETHQIIDQEDWNKPNLPKLWLYNLHYFDDLTAMNSKNRVGWHHYLINRWIQENPINKGNGWESYPISIRVVNWIKWSLDGNEFNTTQIQSLNTQVRCLSKNLETHLLGNHIFANAKALMFAGLFFHGDESNSWYKKGYKIFHNELYEQILPDGGNFELSTMYHSIILEDLLDLFNLHQLYKINLPKEIEGIIKKMIKWLEAMCHPDGEISFFNDAALNNTTSTKELLKYSKRLGFFEQDSLPRLIDFKDSGYSRVSLVNAVAIIDRSPVGPDYLPGHAHADTLSFELSIFSHRFIVNSGTSVYGNGNERIRQRGTAAHSSVVIDKQNSSEVWSGFRVARRARVSKVNTLITNEKVELSASHDGYKRLTGRPYHFRKWIFLESLIEIIDKISGKGSHSIELVFPLHPGVKIFETNKNNIVLGVNNKPVTIEFEGLGGFTIKQSTYHPEFGLSIPNNKLIFEYYGLLPFQVITRIRW